ncbi:helix-turn-helix domain-containing protein [Qipengyuania mesophila]|uniref:helix-turn-helix domain-containing protein n=1 Tax=Qipengyuania mesophila TaxID=2867246 RepID=UPI001FFC96FE|nr:helix-turn-helix domain-containing protein [Qipengyuania mesophila]
MADTHGHSKSRESMPAHQPILPAQAVELVKSRNLDRAETLLADFAAAGLIKTYALVREIRPAGGPTEIVRDAQIPTEDWEMIIATENIQIALNGGTVRLQGSSLQGGIPSVLITGISFSETALVKVLDRYCAASPASITKQASGCNAQATMKCTSSPAESLESQKEVVQPIRSGDLTASVAQAEQATGLGRTTIDKLMRDGTLVRKKVGRRTLITVESIERLVGAKAAG